MKTFRVSIQGMAIISQEDPNKGVVIGKLVLPEFRFANPGCPDTVWRELPKDTQTDMERIMPTNPRKIVGKSSAEQKRTKWNNNQWPKDNSFFSWQNRAIAAESELETLRAKYKGLMEQEPVKWSWKTNSGNIYNIYDSEKEANDDLADYRDGYAIPLYAMPVQPSPAVAVKDHVIARAINELRDIAIEFHSAQQLRERIAGVIRPLLSTPTPPNAEQTHNSSGIKNMTLDDVANRASAFAKRFKAGMVEQPDSAVPNNGDSNMKDFYGESIDDGWYWYSHHSEGDIFHPVLIVKGIVDKSEWYFHCDGKVRPASDFQGFNLFKAVTPEPNNQSKPQRITEQDAREFFVQLGFPEMMFGDWMKNRGGRTLLAKLNEHREPEYKAPNDGMFIEIETFDIGQANENGFRLDFYQTDKLTSLPVGVHKFYFHSSYLK